MGSSVSPDRPLSPHSVPQSMTASAGDVLTELLQLLRDQVCAEMTSTASSALVSFPPISQVPLESTTIISSPVVLLSQAASGVPSSGITC